MAGSRQSSVQQLHSLAAVLHQVARDGRARRPTQPAALVVRVSGHVIQQALPLRLAGFPVTGWSREWKLSATQT